MGNFPAHFLLVLIGYLGGWVFAHSTIADECVRLGGFYVGNKTFVCQLKEK